MDTTATFETLFVTAHTAERDADRLARHLARQSDTQEWREEMQRQARELYAESARAYEQAEGKERLGP